MTAASYKPGDRVQARDSALLVPAGTLGTVTAVYLTMPDACEVYFNGQPAAILMWSDELERADRPADDTPQP
jgi:hypothetical protein